MTTRHCLSLLGLLIVLTVSAAPAAAGAPKVVSKAFFQRTLQGDSDLKDGRYRELKYSRGEWYGSTFFTGSILYLIRRTTGTLIVSMVAHALFDFSVTVQSGPGSDVNDTAGGHNGILFFIWGAGILGLIGHRHLSGRSADSAEQLDTAPAAP